MVEMDDETRSTGSATTTNRGGEVGAPPQSGRGRQHERTRIRCQAERTLRPFWRRPARMARPARVRIRNRNPWVFARRRLFGWNVRLLTRGLQGNSAQETVQVRLRQDRVWRVRLRLLLPAKFT